MKKYVLGLFAVVLAIGFSAFTGTKKAAHHASFDEQVWFDFNGGDENSPASYTLDADNMSDCPQNGTVLCEIHAYQITNGPDAGKPDLSRPFQEVRYTP